MGTIKTLEKSLLEEKKSAELIKNFLIRFQHCCNQKQLPKEASFEQFIARDVKHVANGQLIGETLKDFLSHVEDTQEKYSHLEIVTDKETPFFADKIVVKYTVNATLSGGNKIVLYVMALAKIENGLITAWEQVTNEKDFDVADKSST